MIITVCLFFFSVREKALLKKQQVSLKEVRKDTNLRLFADALVELISSAGGIYISLIMLGTFLNIDVPKEIAVWGVSLDPMALVALVAAVVQPIVVKLFVRLKTNKHEGGV